MTFGRNIQKTLEWSLHVSLFHIGLLFINFSSFKPDTENNASKCANFDEVQFFKTYRGLPKRIIFGTHNLQTFKHNALISELLLM